MIHGLAERKTDISNAVAYTNAATGSLADLLAQARAPFRRWSRETDRVAGIAVADHDYLDNLLNTLPDKYQALVRQGMYGDFFAFYLCDVVLKLNGQGRPAGVHQGGRSEHGTVRAQVKSFSERNPLGHRRRRHRDGHRDRGGRAAVPEPALPQLG